jgi:tetratricopeptide (TPR) repeat protein
MEPNFFSPRLQQEKVDGLSIFFRSAAIGVLILVLGLLPVLFVPGIIATLGFTKVYLVAIAIFVTIILVILSVLRKGIVTLVFPPAIAAFWFFTLVAIVASLLSGDRLDSLTGNGMEIHTSGFMLVLALVMTVTLIFGSARAAVMRLFMVLGLSTILLQLYHLIRLFFGPEVLSFGSLFASATVSPIGSFNDLAIFSGLALLVTMIVLQQTTVSTVGRIVSVIIVLNSLILLAVINFSLVWVIVGFVSLLTALYFIVKDTWLKSDNTNTVPVTRFTMSLIGLICIVSGAFVVGGDYLSGAVNRLSGINYIEVRPSLTSTIDLTRAVYSNNVFLGVGPNRFEDAWRIHKDPIINQTVFWNTNFASGSGYLPTLFITTGLVGGLAFIVFLGTFLYRSYRSLFVAEARDSSWFLIGLVSFAAATYLWLMTILYVPGATIMILAALLTGITVVATLKIRQQPSFTIDVTTSKRHGIALMAAVLIICACSVFLLIGISKQYAATVIYTDTVTQFLAGADYRTVDAGLLRAQTLNPQDLYLAERAQLRLTEINRISSLEVTEANQQQLQQEFNQLVSEGIALTQQAIAIDGTNPDNQILLANFYSLLDPATFEDITGRIEEIFKRTKELDPRNPLHLVLLSQHKARVNKLDETRSLLLEALALKNDYTDALYLLSQLDIQQGNIDSALAFTRSIISIEPNNPTRYFQLGLLLAADQQLQPAAEAFETAVVLGGTYANARYFLALTYLDLGREADALTQLRLVLETNEGNELVKNLISQIESGTYVKPQNITSVPVVNENEVSQEGGVTTTTEVPNTDIVTPLNRTGGDNSTEEAEISNPTEEGSETVETESVVE